VLALEMQERVRIRRDVAVGASNDGRALTGNSYRLDICSALAALRVLLERFGLINFPDNARSYYQTRIRYVF
jgi:hypothetical protein